MSYKVGIVGATGAVGQELIRLLHERSFPVSEIRTLASSRSAGKTITCKDTAYTIVETTPECFDDLDLALFSAGGGTSRALAPEAVKRGCVVVDNSSAFRMEPDVPLVVPEINADALADHKGIVANPNCTTAVAVMGLYPLHRVFGLKRFVAATYQAVSGTGAAAIRELEDQVRAWVEGKPITHEVYPHQIAFNALPHVENFLENGFTKEEMKLQNEGRKIMGLSDLLVSTTCVRIPVFRTHSIAVTAEFEKPVDVAAAREAIDSFPGVEMCDDTASNKYPMPLDYAGVANCAVGRLRKDVMFDNGLSMWVVGDQLWKGAALNAVQIAEALHERDLMRCP